VAASAQDVAGLSEIERAHDPELLPIHKRDHLQKALASMAKSSNASYDEPWGMVSLFWASGSSSGHTAKQ
jgi:hypothetical protein